MSTPHLPIGRTVRYHRRRDGRTVAAIAGLCGITARYLEMIEAETKVPSTEVLARLAAELGVPIAALFAETLAKEPAPPVSTAPSIARALMSHALPASAAVQVLPYCVSGWRPPGGSGSAPGTGSPTSLKSCLR